MKFDQYHISQDIKDNLNKLGFVTPTDIQFKAIPSILNGEDVLAIAQTGTGKTAAFAIPLIDNIHKRKSSKRSLGIKAIIMVPTRELAIQIYEVFEKLSKHTKVKAFAVFGGVEQDNQIKKLQDGIDILIATPGRMFDLISQSFIDIRKVDTIVLDEADYMLELGFLEDIEDIQRKLKHRTHQTLFFSATIDDKIKRLAYDLVNNSAIRIQISPKNMVAKRVSHSVAYIDMDDKRFFLERIIKENPNAKIIVFVRTIIRAERVLKAMQRVNISCDTIHSDKNQELRFSVMDRFKNGENKILIATDVSARGIDIPNVEYVINYDLPEKPENYVHRVGRTGRAHNKGIAISFCSGKEKPLVKNIQKFIGEDIRVIDVSNEYKETIELSGEFKPDLEGLIADALAVESKIKGKKKKRKNL